ncbi:MAG TPA: DUF4124 domain-containing protein [Myxococcales bacterium]
MNRLLVALFALSLIFSASAQAQVYRWVDDQGEVHYTDNPEDIPASKKKTAVKTEGGSLGYVTTGKAAAPKDPPKAPNKADGAQGSTYESSRADDDAKERAAEEEEARREKEWRGRFRDMRARIDRLQRMIDADKKALADPANSGIPMMPPNANGVILPNPEFDAIRRRIPEQEAQLREAKEDLADLEREASRNSVPQNWRR